jgi:hypothetical protein
MFPDFEIKKEILDKYATWEQRMIEILRPWMAQQALITLSLVLVLCLLHAYVHQQSFFRWWLWGWSCFAVSLMGGWVVKEEPGAPGPLRFVLILGAVIAAWMQIACFAIGARVLAARPPTAAWRRWIFALAMGSALLSFVVSFPLHVSPEVAYFIRAAPRQLLLGLVYFYCALRLGQWARHQTSSGAAITAPACAVYSVSQLRRFTDLALIPMPSFLLPDSFHLFLLDLACQGSIIVGMMLLLLQQNQALQQRLQLYQAIIPTCCVCGAVRD